jgi:taurine dioxygenase
MNTAAAITTDRTAPSQAFEVEPLSPAAGVAVRGLDLSAPLSADTVRAVRRLLYEHCVLLIPGQTLDEAQQVRFGEAFGTLAKTLGNYVHLKDCHPAVMYVSNEKANGQYVGALPDGEMYFHSDRCFVETPVLCTMLYGMSIPSSGGNTRFANQYAAYDALPEAMRTRIEGLKAMHIYEPGQDSYNAITMARSVPTPNARMAAHPMVITHPGTGRKALYVNRLMTGYIVGMPREESTVLLEALFDHQEQPQFIYEHRWTPGDVLIWDNRCVNHARTDFDASELRKLRRVVVETEVAL